MSIGAARRVNEIDLLRFVAAMMVLFFHYAFRGSAADALSPVGYPLLAPWAKFGYLGVDLFFMISGFVILMSAAGSSLGSFIASRAARLYPAFWVCCTLTFVAILLAGNDKFHADFRQYAVNMTMLSGLFGVSPIDGVYWSLFVELRFYALVALLLAFRQIASLERYILAWLALSMLSIFLPLGKLGTVLLAGYAPLFSAGALAYLIFTQGASLLRLGGYALAWLLDLQRTFEVGRDLQAAYQTEFSPIATGALVSAFFALMLLVALRRTGYFGRRRWTLAGTLTYPLYLLHQDIGYMLFTAGASRIPPAPLLGLIIAVMLLGAFAVHRGVERPFSPKIRSALEVAFFPRLPMAIRSVLARGSP